MNQRIIGHDVRDVRTRDPTSRAQALRVRIAYGMCHRKTGALSSHMAPAPERIANNEKGFSAALGSRVATPAAPRFCFACDALRNDWGCLTDQRRQNTESRPYRCEIYLAPIPSSNYFVPPYRGLIVRELKTAADLTFLAFKPFVV